MARKKGFFLVATFFCRFFLSSFKKSFFSQWPCHNPPSSSQWSGHLKNNCFLPLPCATLKTDWIRVRPSRKIRPQKTQKSGFDSREKYRSSSGTDPNKIRIQPKKKWARIRPENSPYLMINRIFMFLFFVWNDLWICFSFTQSVTQ